MGEVEYHTLKTTEEELEGKKCKAKMVAGNVEELRSEYPAVKLQLVKEIPSAAARSRRIRSRKKSRAAPRKEVLDVKPLDDEGNAVGFDEIMKHSQQGVKVAQTDRSGASG